MLESGKAKPMEGSKNKENFELSDWGAMELHLEGKPKITVSR